MRGPALPPGPVGPTDKPSYFFMGLPRSPSIAPQGTPFSDVYAEAVKSSPELRQLRFTPQYASLGSRLDAILGVNPNGEGRIDRLVDLTVGMDPATAKGMDRAIRRSSTWTGTGARTTRHRGSPTMAEGRSSPASP